MNYFKKRVAAPRSQAYVSLAVLRWSPRPLLLVQILVLVLDAAIC
jgi:hypothetical protein